MIDIMFALAELFIVVSYVFRDIFILRILSIIGMSGYVMGSIIAGLDQPGMRSLLFFSGLAVLINALQVAKLVTERYSLFLHEDEKHLYKTMFSSMTALEFKRLNKLSRKYIFLKGEFIAKQNQPINELIVINKGNVSIIKDDIVVANLGAGFFIGEMSFLTGEMATATVRADEDVECTVWLKETLKRFEAKNPEIYNKLKQDISLNLIKKIMRPRQQ